MLKEVFMILRCYFGLAYGRCARKKHEGQAEVITETKTTTWPGHNYKINIEFCCLSFITEENMSTGTVVWFLFDVVPTL